MRDAEKDLQPPASMKSDALTMFKNLIESETRVIRAAFFAMYVFRVGSSQRSGLIVTVLEALGDVVQGRGVLS